MKVQSLQGPRIQANPLKHPFQLFIRFLSKSCICRPLFNRKKRKHALGKHKKSVKITAIKQCRCSIIVYSIHDHTFQGLLSEKVMDENIFILSFPSLVCTSRSLIAESDLNKDYFNCKCMMIYFQPDPAKCVKNTVFLQPHHHL